MKQQKRTDIDFLERVGKVSAVRSAQNFMILVDGKIHSNHKRLENAKKEALDIGYKDPKTIKKGIFVLQYRYKIMED